jgi:hypothetical protein
VPLYWHVLARDEVRKGFLDLAYKTTSRLGDTLSCCGTDVGPLSPRSKH